MQGCSSRIVRPRCRVVANASETKTPMKMPDVVERTHGTSIFLYFCCSFYHSDVGTAVSIRIRRLLVRGRL